MLFMLWPGVAWAEGPDTTPPAFDADSPREGAALADGSRAVRVIFETQDMEQVYYYLVLLPEGADLPTKEQVRDGTDGNGSPALNLKTNYGGSKTSNSSMTIEAPQHSTSYDIYMVLEDDAGKVSEPAKVDVTTPPAADLFFEGYPDTGAVQAPASKEIKILVKIQVPSLGAGQVHYVLVERDASLPSVDQVIAGKDSTGAVALDVGTITCYNNNEKDFLVTGDDDATDYDLFLVARDTGTSPAPCTEVVRLEVTTPPATTTQLDTPEGLAWDSATPGKATWGVVDNAFSYSVQLNKDGGIYITVNSSGTEYDFTDDIKDEGAGSYTFKVTAIGDGTTYTDSSQSEASLVYNYTGSTPAPAATVTASAATLTPVAGTPNEITFTVKDAAGDTDTTFTGDHQVTLSGAQVMTGGDKCGSFGGFTIDDSGTLTTDVRFIDGVSNPKPDLCLRKAVAQTISFSVAGVTNPSASVNFNVVPHTPNSMSLTQNITAPAVNGGQFAQQPRLELKDPYNNLCTNDSATQVTASKNDDGDWTLTGTTVVTAVYGIATFTDLGATNTEQVTGAQLKFAASGSVDDSISAAVTLPAPTVSDDVCKIGETGYATLDAALDKVLDGETITLLQSIDHSQPIVIDGKAVTFGLSSFILNIDTSATAGSTGLTASNGGKVSCTGSGKLNVTAYKNGVVASGGSEIRISGNVTAGQCGITTSGGGNPKVTVDGDVTVTGVGASGEVEAISAGGFATVTIGGHVMADRATSSQIVTAIYANGSTIAVGKDVTTKGSGINVQNNGEVTIEGALNFDPTGTGSQSYIKLGYPNVIKTSDDFEETSSKSGYKEYRNGDNIAWIRDAVQLGTPTGLAWDASGEQLKATWNSVPSANQYKVEYYKDGVKLGLSTNVNPPSTSTDDMKDNLLVWGEGNYTFTVQATAGTGSYLDSDVSEPSASYPHGQTTTYVVTVNASYASLTGAGSYVSGATVNIHAGNRTGYTFTGWSSDHVTITNADNKEASFTMPDKNVTVTANWSYNGGGGSSGSAAQPTVPAAGGAVRVNYTTSSGTAPLVLPASKVNEIIDKSEGSEAIIDLSEISGITSALLPIAALSAFEEEGFDVTIKLPSGTLTLDTVAAASVAEQATSSDLRLELKQVATSSLTEVQKQAVQSGDVVVDINIYSGTKKITNFDGNLTIQIPYDGPQPVAIWYLSDEGELENIPCTFKDGIVSFDLNHLSLYVVGRDYEEQPPSPPEPELPADVVGHWARESIAQLIETGIVSGYPDGSFQPDKTVTRAEFTVMLLKALKLEQKSGPVFKDTATHWAKDAIASAAAYGLVKGYDQNNFGPDHLITREQAAVMIAGAAKLEAAQEVLEFTDAGQISAWAISGVAAAATGKILTGYPDNSFRPQGKLTRAEAAAIIAKLL